MSHSSDTDTPGKKNRLAAEKSPYLLQHADNPVDWYPWGEDAFAHARAENKPIFLSIGYATCHWCHVMERESFSDPIVAALMNEAFVNIKVDREERPDIDQVYMTVCQMLTGSGGWPLTIVMTPDKTPFFAATYLPRETRFGRMGMIDLAPRVQQLWSTEREKLLASAGQISDRLATVARSGGAGAAIDNTLPTRAYADLERRFDSAHGGFGSAPKFPSPHTLVFLARHSALAGQPRALEMVDRTLGAMRRGGVFDQVGFGFHRYSTDAAWLVPHFEKMLYDQAMMMIACTEAVAAGVDDRHRRTAYEIADYVLRVLTSPDGTFYSAEDADSEGEEGQFYLWSTDELEQVLGPDDAAFAATIWNVRAEGNFTDEATGRRSGVNILHRSIEDDDAAAALGLGPQPFASRLESVRFRLFERREARVHPLKDDKVLADWNGLMAAALARAGRIFDEPRFVAAAERAVAFIETTMRGDGGRLYHRYRDGDVAIPAFLDDHAFLAWARLELYEATLDPGHLGAAARLQAETDKLFWDEKDGGYFFAAIDDEELLVHQKEIYDGAIPSGNSVAAMNLVRLARLTGRDELTERASRLFAAFAADFTRGPSAHSHLADAFQLASAPSSEVVIAGEAQAKDTRALLEVTRSVDRLQAALLLVPAGPDGDRIRRLAPFAADHLPVDGRATAYVCRDFACRMPTTDPEELRRLLEHGV